MHLILTGATGLVGSGCLQEMITNKAVTTVSILSRRSVPMAEGHEKVQVIVTKDFNNYSPEVLEKLKGAEGCVWALGVSQIDVPDLEKYIEITAGYPVVAAKTFSSLSDPFKFVYVSGEGATTEPGIFTQMFGKVKGQAEKSLLELSKTTPSLKPYSLRPGGVDPAFQPEVHPFVPEKKSLFAKLSTSVILPTFRVVYPAMISPTKELGQVLVELAMSDGKPLEGKGISGEGRTISNGGMRRLASL